MTCYRKIWREANGPIPKDVDGRSYEIHHINGDHSDDRLENLKCVSILEHFEIHLSQGDYGAAAAVAKRMKIAPEEQKKLDSLAGKQAFKEKKGFHAFTAEEKAVHSRKGGLAHRGRAWWTNGVESIKSAECPGEGWHRGRIVTGTGPKIGSKIGVFWNNGYANIRAEERPGPEWIRGRFLTERQRDRRSEIASNLIVSQAHKDAISQKLSGKTQPKVECPICGKIGGAGAMSRFHFDNCKSRS